MDERKAGEEQFLQIARRVTKGVGRAYGVEVEVFRLHWDNAGELAVLQYRVGAFDRVFEASREEIEDIVADKEAAFQLKQRLRRDMEVTAMQPQPVV